MTNSKKRALLETRQALSLIKTFIRLIGKPKFIFVFIYTKYWTLSTSPKWNPYPYKLFPYILLALRYHPTPSSRNLFFPRFDERFTNISSTPYVMFV